MHFRSLSVALAVALVAAIAFLLSSSAGTRVDATATSRVEPTTAAEESLRERIDAPSGRLLREVDSVATPPTDTAVDASATVAAVVELAVTLSGPEGEPVPARLLLTHDDTDRDVPDARADLASDPVALLRAPRPGRYSLVVGDYPVGYVPPRSASRRSFTDDEIAVCDFEVDLDVGRTRLDLVMDASAIVEGHVVDDRGIGVEGAKVGAHVMTKSSTRSFYGTTGADGRYRLRCAPGDVRVRLHFARSHAASTLARPLPRNLTLGAGSTNTVDFRVTESGGRITGRIEDQDGRPVEDMVVLAYFRPDETSMPEEQRRVYTQRDYVHSTRSGAGGVFVLAGMPSGRFGVRVGPDDYDPVGQGRLGMIGPREIVSVAPNADVDLGVMNVVASRPFRVEGRIARADGGAIDRDESNTWRLFAILQAGARRAKVREQKVRFRYRDGACHFAWACETPEDGVLLELRGPNGLVAQEPLFPVPDGNARATLTVSR